MMRTLLLLAVMCGSVAAQGFNTAGPPANAFNTGLNVLGTVEDRDRIVVDTRAVQGELNVANAYHGFNTGDVVNLHITKVEATAEPTNGQHVAIAPPRVAPAAYAAVPTVTYVQRTQCNARGGCTTVWVPVTTMAQAPTKVVQAPAPGMHSHKCAACGYVWSHFPGDSHTCPACGHGGNYAKYNYNSTTTVTTTASSGREGKGLRGLLPRNWGK